VISQLLLVFFPASFYQKYNISLSAFGCYDGKSLNPKSTILQRLYKEAKIVGQHFKPTPKANIATCQVDGSVTAS